MSSRILTDDEIAEYRNNGYVIVRSLFDDAEMQLLRTAREVDADIKKNVHAMYTPLQKVPDEAIKNLGLKLEEKKFYRGAQ